LPEANAGTSSNKSRDSDAVGEAEEKPGNSENDAGLANEFFEADNTDEESNDEECKSDEAFNLLKA
jgi:hypothetical protein